MSTKEERSKFIEENDRYLRQIVQNDLAKYRQPFVAHLLNVQKASN